MLLATSPVAAAGLAAARIAIPATSLSTAILLLARQTGADITTIEPDLAAVRVVPLAGTYSAAAALDRLLAGTGFRATAITAGSFRIDRVPRRPPPLLPPPPPPASEPPIIVTASKRQVALLNFPGSIQYLGADAVRAITAQSHDIDDIARTLPVLQNTELGRGRNKTFIRGIADSSFNGATQSAASVYFGDVQTGYSGADPGLALYDVRSVEILEGPQGTLYGAGSISGIIRVTPNAVDLRRPSASAGAGVTMMRDGGAGYDLNGVMNLPILDDRLGIRAVGYYQRDGGFIDDAGRNLANINSVVTRGGRLAVRAMPGAGWQIDTSAVVQDITGADAQYAVTGVGPLARVSAFAQPWYRTLVMGRLVITKDWDNGLQLVSATGIVADRAEDNFDATGVLSITRPTLYVNQGDNLLLSQETRLTQTRANGGSWLIGSAFLYDRNIQTRAVGSPDNEQDIIGVKNTGRSLSLFAEATFALGKAISLTTGARLTRARNDGVPTPDAGGTDFARGLTTTRIDPTLAVSWRLAPRLAAFGRFQTGFRTGGLAVARGFGRVADFRPDSIVMTEIGLRSERRALTGIAFSSALSYARWSDIQADLVGRRGQPYTANIGDADIYGFEGSMDWVPLAGLTAGAAFFYTYNRVYGPQAQTTTAANQQLPQTPSFAANAELAYRWQAGAETELHLGLTTRYVGRSVLGSSSFLDVSQGDYAIVGARGGWSRRGIEASVTIDNLTDRRANRFAYGNPFLIADRNQFTPVQPRSIRLGVGFAF